MLRKRVQMPQLHPSCAVQVDLTLNIVERKTGGLSCGGGISSQGHSEGALPGFIGSASFTQRNLFGLNQKLAATLEIGQVNACACCSFCASQADCQTPLLFCTCLCGHDKRSACRWTASSE